MSARRCTPCPPTIILPRRREEVPRPDAATLQRARTHCRAIAIDRDLYWPHGLAHPLCDHPESMSPDMVDRLMFWLHIESDLSGLDPDQPTPRPGTIGRWLADVAFRWACTEASAFDPTRVVRPRVHTGLRTDPSAASRPVDLMIMYPDPTPNVVVLVDRDDHVTQHGLAALFGHVTRTGAHVVWLRWRPDEDTAWFAGMADISDLVEGIKTW